MSLKDETGDALKEAPMARNICKGCKWYAGRTRLMNRFGLFDPVKACLYYGYLDEAEQPSKYCKAKKPRRLS